eukprot:TRINITY_DN35760_c0_g1_i1.p1 TRINITY_DN35760_c0_g1~~TRINITY_DN35760_c0_g1_i1.p1  ORF type:complete len:831 (+),score=222.21 TRINITY_DN35760_c0_g1_i1:213-2705(+)
MRDTLTIIIAGYEDDIHKKLYAFNDGLCSRFEEVLFDDFSEMELCACWNDMVRARGFFADNLIGGVVAKRLVKGTKRKGFGNARSVRNVLESAVKSAMSRNDFDGVIIAQDVLGTDPSRNPKIQAILAEFDAKIGWSSVKQTVRQLVNICAQNYQKELLGQAPQPVFLNRMFLGNPGTGKTTCAEMYARLLKELKFLSVGTVVLATASDLIGQHVGESQTKTNALFKRADGKVLVIDEAYTLDDNQYGKQALDVIVERVQNAETDDRVVLLLGYEKQMLRMIDSQNPGLARRFPRDQAFVFEDYSEDELLEIFKASCNAHHVKRSIDVLEKASIVLEKQKRLGNFGNAGAVDVLIKAAIARASERGIGADSLILLPEDIEVHTPSSGLDPLSLLDSLFRIGQIKEKLVRLQNTLRLAMQEGGHMPEAGNFVFQGSPGTGKTTVARVMARILYQIGFLASDKVVETSALGLTGEYLGHTKKRVEEKIREARGGVLFIDEAYELGKGPYAEEAMTSLVAAMTDPEFRGTVFIIAGYVNEIDEMLNRNIGLKSRFDHFFNFEDWNPEDCRAYFKQQLAEKNFRVEEEVLDLLERYVSTLICLPGWGNGRDMSQIVKQVLSHRAHRVSSSVRLAAKEITCADVEGALQEMILSRQVRGSGVRVVKSSFPFNQASADFRPERPLESLRKIEGKLEDPLVSDGEEEKVVDGRDNGVTDHIWAELEAAKQRYYEEQRRVEEERIAEEKRQKELQEALARMAEAERQEALRKEQERIRELERRAQKLREEQQIKQRLRQLMKCPAGYEWFKCGNGWRCSGGSHFVSNEQLERQFTANN